MHLRRDLEQCYIRIKREYSVLCNRLGQKQRKIIIGTLESWSFWHSRGLTEWFADYLCHGSPFVVYTDNNPLTYVLTSAKLSVVGQRWVNDLADFNFTIRYKPGKENIDADLLSCKPIDISELKHLCSESISSQWSFGEMC